ncbi:MAG: formylglycine-generating enzyme family protein [Pirellulaceae bacterium]|nr:formylglycine-generating enzyme family protein [Pirellulaceae bacterium]
MISLIRSRVVPQPAAWLLASLLTVLASVVGACLWPQPVHAQDVPKLTVPNADAGKAEQMKPYAELIERTDATIEMLPIPGGTFLMGSPDDEAGRQPDEGPQRKVTLEPFWMGKYEITWDAFEVWMFDLDVQRRKLAREEPNARDSAADEYQVSQPTEPYTDMTFGMGKKGYPAICMTQLAAKTFCQWLSAKTGRYYRLPTEAEWEYACRAGTTTAYSFGDDPDALDDFAWYYDNSNGKYQPVGKKKPNPWGLYDMHGNVTEWVLDQYVPDIYQKFAGEVAENPLVNPTTLYPRVVRGGSWDSDPEMLRSAARDKSTPEWKQQDPQIPKSIWYHTDALHVGFRIVRPLRVPTDKERQEKWDKAQPVEDRKAGR